MVTLNVGKEKETPMVRFLNQTATMENTKYPGAYPMYSQQWRTLWKAFRLGYITEGYGDMVED